MKSKNYIPADEKIYWAAFYYSGIGGEKKLRLLFNKFGSLKKAWDYFCNNRTKYPKTALKLALTENLIQKIRNFSLEKLKSDLEKFNIRLITLDSAEYPKKLRATKNPPLVLYYVCQSALREVLTDKILAVVGTRRATAYGKKALNHLLPEIVKRNIGIVSGLAFGIDIYAHKLTLEQGKKTVAVLAGGLDSVYPSEHKIFAKEIVAAGGALLSEFPPGTPYLRQYFPARNRIISGLADAVLVVEAKRKSGALITIDFAFSQGKKVLAVPGSIFSEQSRSVNGLFKKGASPIQNPENILEALYGDKKLAGTDFKSISAEKIDLAAEEKEILRYISFDFATSLNVVIRKTGFPAAKVVAVITRLELKGIVNSVNGSSYQKNINI